MTVVLYITRRSEHFHGDDWETVQNLCEIRVHLSCGISQDLQKEMK